VAELEEALLGRLPRRVDGVNAAPATTGAAQDIDAEGVLVEGGQSRRRVVRRFFFWDFGAAGGATAGAGSVTVGRKAALRLGGLALGRPQLHAEVPFGWSSRSTMCRNIRRLHHFEPPAT